MAFLNQYKKNSFTLWIFLFLSAVVLTGAALYNGYPLVYADTGTYIESGFTLETPFDRPIIYGLFLFIFSFGGLSLWTVIFAQSFIFSIVFYLCIKNFITKTNAAKISLIIIIVLSVFSSLSWVSSHLLPDIFTPICLLCMLLLLFNNSLSNAWFIFVYVVLFISTACHISHIAINILFILSITVSTLINKNKKSGFLYKHAIGIGIITILAVFTMGSSIGKSRHVFLMGHLLETGILDAYLDDHCKNNNTILCDLRGSLPNDAGSFMWNTHGDSVLIKSGGWQGTKIEYDKIIKASFTTPKYLLMHLTSILKTSLKQVITFRIGEGNGAYDKNTLIYQRIAKYVPYEIREYSFSNQNMNYLAELPFVNLINSIFIGICLVYITIQLFYFHIHQKLCSQTIILTKYLFLGYIINCCVCSNLSTLANRFGCREVWIIPLIALLFFYKNKLEESQTNTNQ